MDAEILNRELSNSRIFRDYPSEGLSDKILKTTNWSIRDNDTGELIFVPDFSNNIGNYARYYLIITSLENPFNSSFRFFNVGGSHNVGTGAAINMLRNDRFPDLLAGSAKKSGGWQCIVPVDLNAQEPLVSFEARAKLVVDEAIVTNVDHIDMSIWRELIVNNLERTQFRNIHASFDAGISSGIPY